MGRQLSPNDTIILVVDDDDEVRELVSEYLRDFGYLILEAPSAAAALAIVDTHSEVDLVITDIRMPEMTGLELAARFAERGRPRKIIFMSGYFSPQPITWPFLRKPFRLSELENVVRAELAA